MTPFSSFRNGFPEPDVQAVTALFGELGKRVASGKIRVLNIDNANPGTISNYPEESARMLEAIAAAITPGDTLALGIESFDPQVIARNNLKVSRGGPQGGVPCKANLRSQGQRYTCTCRQKPDQGSA
jgi:radical SAM superfamily enzyme with C-terminal helix-hairpin-helix motif